MHDQVRTGIEVRNADAADIAWAGEKLAVRRWAEDTIAITVWHGEERKAVILYNMLIGNGCMAHIVSDGSKNWMTRGVRYCMFAYPFVQIGLHRITICTGVNNLPAQIYAMKLGFSFEARLRGASDDGSDQIMFTMRREECRWLIEDHHHG